MAAVLSLIVQLLSGAVGSNLLASVASKFNLGPVGNLIAGALGGVSGSNLLNMILGTGASTAAAAAGGGDLASIVTQIVGGGIGGSIVTAVVGAIRNAMSGPRVA
jgi:hypothetical protein